MSGKNKANENIQVYVRCRPINARERNINSQVALSVVSDREVVVKQQPLSGSSLSKKFTFDRTFGPESKQSDVYQVVVAPLINEVVAGYNCTVFAYGQTGTGKTYTMIGDETPRSTASYEDPTEMGIIPRALSHMFDELRSMDVEFTMRISYLELYNEELCDLLSSNDVTQIRIFEDPNKKGSIIVQGLEEIPVHSTADVYKLLAKGQEKRRMATTLMNAQSSRSHTVFSILVHIKEKGGIEGEEMLKIGKLNLVDLAGSENISKAGNEKGIRARETVNINQSLLTLGRVITALVERTPHVPYRESKLTRLLQESLGGRTKTSIIATISPGHKDLEETTSTLEYANRAKNIQNKPEVNQKLSKKTVIKEYTEEIDRLKRDLIAARDKNGVFMAEETYNQMNYQLETQKAELADQINKLRAEKEKVSQQQLKLAEINDELVVRTEQLKESECALTETSEILDKAKRGYQEKKQLLLKHVQTERTLTNQAKQLMDVANVVTTDVHKLHDIIACRKNYDQNNREACKNLDANLNGNFKAISNNNTAYRSALNDQTSSLVQKMNTNTTQSKEFCATMITNLNTLIDAEQQAKQVIEGFLATGLTEVQAIFQKHHAEKEQILRAAEEQRNALQQKYLELQASVDASYQTFEKDHCELEILKEQHFSCVIDHQEKMKRELVTEKENIVSEIQSSRQILAQSTGKYDQLTSKLSGMLDEMKTLVDETRTESLTKLRSVHSDLGTVEMQISTNCANHIVAFDQFKTEMMQKNNTITDQLNTCMHVAKQIKTDEADLVRMSTQNEKQLFTSLSEMNKNYEAQQSAFVEKVNHTFGQVENLCEITRIDIDGGLNGIIRDVSTEQERIDTHQFEYVDMTNTLLSTQNEFHESLSMEINVCQSKLDKFQRDELQLYTPTGETPTKRDYKYPKVLAVTSPHSKIITDFWRTNNPSDLECSAIISEETIDDNGAESTMLPEQTNAPDSSMHSFDQSLAERTLCESHTFNANSISTPFSNNFQKQILTPNLSCIGPQTLNCDENKEN